MTQILLIDDDLLEHKMFEVYLASGQTRPYQLHTASDMQVAIQTLQSVKMDYVFLDDRFAPYKSALETLPHLLDYFGKAKVTVISSATDARHLQCPEQLGVSNIVDKFDVKSVLSHELSSIEKVPFQRVA